MADFELKKRKPRVDEDGNVIIEKPNMRGSPSKIRHGNSGSEHLFGKQVEYMKEPYDVERKIRRVS